MTVNTSANKVVAAGNGVQTVFPFTFIGVAASDITVILTDSAGTETTIAPANYTLALNPVPPGQIWGIGGNVTYSLVGSPIPMGSTLTIVRTLPLSQLVALGNQGNEFPSAVEAALDLLEMQLQQVSELFQRAIVAPVVDPSAPLPLPPAAQRANQALVFDGAGNPVAGQIPAAGIISTAMQAVVGAATLALARAAMGLGAMALKGIGGGLQDDGAGNARVIFAVNQVATTQAIGAAAYLTKFIAGAAVSFNLAGANTLFSGFGFWVDATGGDVTLVPNVNDTIRAQTATSGAPVRIPQGTSVFVKTDAAASGSWWIEWQSSSAQPTAPGGFANLRIANNTGAPNTSIDVSADEVVVLNSVGGAARFTGVALTINCLVNGANGLDAGALQANGPLAVWVISNGTTVAGLASASFSNPTMPAGYTFKKRVGAMVVNGFLFRRTLQWGRRTQYTPTLPSFINSGSISAWTSFSMALLAPPTAAVFYLRVNATLIPSGQAAIAPNASDSVSGSPSGFWMGSTCIAGNVFCQDSISMLNEDGNVYARATGALQANCEGWDDNI